MNILKNEELKKICGGSWFRSTFNLFFELYRAIKLSISFGISF